MAYCGVGRKKPIMSLCSEDYSQILKDVIEHHISHSLTDCICSIFINFSPASF